MAFTIPSRLLVREGNAGNHRAEFWYRDSNGVTVNCDFRGGSDAPHPEDDFQRALGREYVFDRCSNGATAGAAAQATWFKLHVRVGDQKDPAGRTEIELSLGGTPALEPPLSAAESVKLRDAFSWEKTQAVAERNGQHLPTLYYALVYVEDREQLAALDELQVHHDGLPLFAEEFQQWNGQQGYFLHESDGRGIFRFAIIPGIIYNQIRQAALEGHIIFRVVSLRSVPASVRDIDGSISYAALRASAFRYRDEDPSLTSQSTGLGQVRQELFGSIVRKIVQAIAEVAEGVVDEVRKGIGAVDRYVNGAVTLTVDVRVLNMDPAFDRTRPMQRAWGKDAGSDIRLKGVRVSARQRQLVGPISTLFQGETAETGFAQLKVTQGLVTSFCVAVESSAAEVTNFLTEIEYCEFPEELADVNKTVTLKFQDNYSNILAQASDAREYLMNVVGFTPHKATILVGPLTWLWGKLSNGTGAMAPCFGLPNLVGGTALDAVAAEICLNFAALLGPEAFTACYGMTSALYGVDIILPGGNLQYSNGITYDTSLSSRGVLTHEYGHFTLCSMLYDENVLTYSAAYSGAMLSRMDPDPDPDDMAAYINEAFADFISSQVVGATNYFQSSGDYSSFSMNYCGASSPSDGLEYNQGASASTFKQRLAEVTSTLHDAFDGWAPGLDAPGPANLWQTTGAAKPPLLLRPTQPMADEVVQLPGSRIRRLIHELDNNGTWLTTDNLMSGVSTLAAQAGNSWCDRCLLFALHTPGFMPPMTPAKEAALCMQSPIRDWLGPKPAAEAGCGLGGTITGRVLLQSAPVAGAQVELSYQGRVRASALTDANGGFAFDGVKPESSAIELVASVVVEGQPRRGTASVQVSDGRAYTVDIHLNLDFPRDNLLAPGATLYRDGRLVVFARGTDGTIWHRWQIATNGDWSEGWESLGTPPGGTASDPDATLNAPGGLVVFVRGADGAIWHRWQDRINAEWSGWESLGGNFTSSPGATLYEDGRLVVFGRGTDGAIWHRWQIATNGDWSEGWESLGTPPGGATSDPDATLNAPGGLVVFVRGADGAIWHRWQDRINAEWSGWESLGGNFTSSPGATLYEDGRLVVFGRGTDGTIWHRWQIATNGDWSEGWESLGTPPGGATSSPDATLNAPGGLVVFTRGADGAIWHRWQDHIDAEWSGWESLGAP